MTIYFISGLGADERIFGRLSLPGHWTVKYIPWLMPQQGETLVHYAQRMAQGINTHEPFAIAGLSFGGMVAVELGKILPAQHIILLSSVATRQQLPPFYKWVGKWKLDQIVPAAFFKIITPFTYWYFGAKTKAEKELLVQFIRQASPHYLRWAIHQVVNWQNTTPPVHLLHIHGSADHVFPDSYIEHAIVVKGGAHLMVYDKAEEISKLLIKHIDNA